MIKTPILKRKTHTWLVGGFWQYRINSWEICSDTLASIFAIPETATRLQLVAYKRPGKGRVPIKLIRDSDFVEIEGMRSPRYILDSTSRPLKPLVRGHCDWHVECYYWEDK